MNECKYVSVTGINPFDWPELTNRIVSRHSIDPVRTRKLSKLT